MYTVYRLQYILTVLEGTTRYAGFVQSFGLWLGHFWPLANPFWGSEFIKSAPIIQKFLPSFKVYQ